MKEILETLEIRLQAAENCLEKATTETQKRYFEGLIEGYQESISTIKEKSEIQEDI